jgi:hypothetical protein
MAAVTRTLAEVQSTSPMRRAAYLTSLPTEIVQQICADFDPLSLKAVRLVCKALYNKTLYLFKRYIENIRIFINPKGLSKLLQLVSVPFLRDQIKRIAVLNLPDRPPSPFFHVALQEQEAWEQSSNSSDTYYILQEVFHQLKNGACLRNVHVGYPSQAILAAIHASGFDKSKLSLTLSPERVSPEATFDTFGSGKIGRLNISRHFNHSGYSSHGLSSLLKATSQAEELIITGCAGPRYTGWNFIPKSCDGCADLWNADMRFITYTNLRVFVLQGHLVDGIFLRSFIKRHQAILKDVTFERVALTRGTWTAIFQVLRHGQLDKLTLDALHQKKHDLLMHHIIAQETNEGIQVRRDHVNTYLDILCHGNTIYREPGVRYREIPLPVVSVAVLWDPAYN